MHILSAERLPFDPNQVTPGVIGFAVTALVATVIMLLMWDFNRRVRRINDRADVKARIDAELAAQQAAPAPEPAAGGAEAPSGDAPRPGA
ncbi:MAG: hypothetical protein ACQEWM_10655 [Actinomycetota bacterium]